jgi:hypothetical protein
LHFNADFPATLLAPFRTHLHYRFALPWTCLVVVCIAAPLGQSTVQILERRPASIIPRLKEILAQPDPTLGYFNGELRFWLGWAQAVAGDRVAAQESLRKARSELEALLKEQPENHFLIGDLALVNMMMGDKAAALALAERCMTPRARSLPIFLCSIKLCRWN